MNNFEPARLGNVTVADIEEFKLDASLHIIDFREELEIIGILPFNLIPAPPSMLIKDAYTQVKIDDIDTIVANSRPLAGIECFLNPTIMHKGCVFWGDVTIFRLSGEYLTGFTLREVVEILKTIHINQRYVYTQIQPFVVYKD